MQSNFNEVLLHVNERWREIVSKALRDSEFEGTEELLQEAEFENKNFFDTSLRKYPVFANFSPRCMADFKRAVFMVLDSRNGCKELTTSELSMRSGVLITIHRQKDEDRQMIPVSKSSGTLVKIGEEVYITTLAHCLIKDADQVIKIVHVKSGEEIQVDIGYYFPQATESVRLGHIIDISDEPALLRVLSLPISPLCYIATCATEEPPMGGDIEGIGFPSDGNLYTKGSLFAIGGTIGRGRYFCTTDVVATNGVSGAGMFYQHLVCGVLQGQNTALTAVPKSHDDRLALGYRWINSLVAKRFMVILPIGSFTDILKSKDVQTFEVTKTGEMVFQSSGGVSGAKEEVGAEVGPEAAAAGVAAAGVATRGAARASGAYSGLLPPVHPRGRRPSGNLEGVARVLGSRFNADIEFQFEDDT